MNIRAHLLALSLMATLGSADPAGLGVGEIDVIFPRNKTFDPMPLMPVVFAIQNPAAINRLYATLSYGLWSTDTPRQNQIHMTHLSVQKLSDPEESVSFLLGSVPNTLNTENEWEFVWKLRWTNCSTPANGTTFHDEHGLVEERDFAWRPSWTGRSIYFTTKRGGTQSNLTALSTGDACDDGAQTLAFNVTKTLKAPGGSLEGKTCAVLASLPPTPAPCKASVAPAAASSISSALTAGQCTAATPVISCPAKSGGVAISEANSQLKWWAAGLVLLVGKSIV